MIESEDQARAFVAARCDAAAMAALESFGARLRVENARQNLVSAASLDWLWWRHIADSAQLLDHFPRERGPWLDLGSGAGFPGLVIAIMRPGLQVRLVESRKLRVEWLQDCVEAAHLRCCEVIGSRLEAVKSFSAAAISARAFAPLPKLVASAERFSTADTVWLLPKGRSAAQEVEQLPSKLRRMFHVEPSATDADSGIVVGWIAKG